MLESHVEQTLKRRVEKEIPGAMCLKFVSPGLSGVPDRLILLPGGKQVFAELKQPKKTERARQEYVQSRMRKLGCMVFSRVDTPERVAEVVAFCKRMVGECQ